MWKNMRSILMCQQKLSIPAGRQESCGFMFKKKFILTVIRQQFHIFSAVGGNCRRTGERREIADDKSCYRVDDSAFKR
jgi:hypothetical protein